MPRPRPRMPTRSVFIGHHDTPTGTARLLRNQPARSTSAARAAMRSWLSRCPLRRTPGLGRSIRPPILDDRDRHELLCPQPLLAVRIDQRETARFQCEDDCVAAGADAQRAQLLFLI